MHRLASAALLALACTFAVHAEDATPAPAPALHVVHCGQLFDAASGRMRGETSIVVRGNRTESVQAGTVYRQDGREIAP